jgi:hypothetical protein
MKEGNPDDHNDLGWSEHLNPVPHLLTVVHLADQGSKEPLDIMDIHAT